MKDCLTQPIEAAHDGSDPNVSERRPEVFTPRLPELLAPAGDWECARAAIENGADAIYFGLEHFNARMRANNFTEADLPALMEFLHRRGAKGYVTFNTLIFANELAEAEQSLRTIIAAGVDAAIVQDVGICRLLRRLSPDFPIHASTQMTITSAAGVEFARELGCQLVVLARECSVAEIEKIRAAPPAQGPGRMPLAPLPLEVFVHGALCVAYSGQCLTSEALGGRSANRGECAQACRMPYDLISDGQQVPLGDRRYLLSPQDLAGLPILPELIRSGVASLKIEGRLKSPEYVANITRVYRQALESLAGFARVPSPTQENDPGESKIGGSTPAEFDAACQNSRYDLEMAFSRGLHTGWLGGLNNQELVHARFGKKRGVFLGEVARVERDAVSLQLAAPLKPGDGVVFDRGRPDEPEEGGRVYEVESRGSTTLLRFGWGNIDFSRIRTGDKLWKTSDPELDRRLRQTYSSPTPRFRRPLHGDVHGREGQPMTLVFRDELGHVAQVESASALVRAEKQPLTDERLRDQLGRLGGTPFQLGRLRNSLIGSVILPMSELNQMRRDAVEQIEAARARPRRWQWCAESWPSSERSQDGCSLASSVVADAPVNSPDNHNRNRSGHGPLPATDATLANLIVLVRNLPQLEAALDADVSTIYCEFENPKRYRDAVAAVRQAGSPTAGQREVFVAPPRIFKMGEEWTLTQVRSCEADGYLVRNYDHLTLFADTRRIGDFSLNVANPLTADYFKNRFNLERVTASYDLNFVQLEALLQSAPPAWFEITIHQHIPMFHMEHCVFCAFLGSGTDYSNCGRPCDRHELKLRDRVGAQHPIKADVGCRNTVFNALAQTGADYVARMLALGVRHFRLEFLDESPDQVTRTIQMYRRLLGGEVTGATLWRELKLLNQLGVTRGPMA